MLGPDDLTIFIGSGRTTCCQIDVLGLHIHIGACADDLPATNAAAKEKATKVKDAELKKKAEEKAAKDEVVAKEKKTNEQVDRSSFDGRAVRVRGRQAGQTLEGFQYTDALAG